MHTAHIAIDPQTKECRIQTCTEHSRSVAHLTKGILVPCGLGSMGYLAGLLHDCGKFTDEFDDYITRASNNEQVRKGSVIHTFAGVRCIMELFHTPTISLWKILWPRSLPSALAVTTACLICGMNGMKAALIIG